MPKKRKCRLKALPERQCKKPRISISLRENRKSINYNETIEISSEDSKGKHEDEQIDDVENSSNSSVVILDNVKQGENGKPSFFESINISFHDERFPEGNTDGEDLKELQKPEEFSASVSNEETPVENGEITQNKVEIEALNIPTEKGCGSTISLSSCDSKSTSSKRKKRNSKKQPTISEEIFYVEKILEMKYENGKRLFFLKWEGFPESENSWEPEENIQSNTMVEEFLESLKNCEKNKTNEIELEANKLNKHDDNEVKNMEEMSDKNCNDVISDENVIKCHEENGNVSSNIKEEILNASNPSSVIVISNENSNSISDQKSINIDHNEGQSDKNDIISTKIVLDIKEESKVSTGSSIQINNVTEESESKEFPTNLSNLISSAEKLATVDYDESAPIVTQENQLLETTQLEDVSVHPEIHRSTSSLSISFRKKKKSKKKNRRKGKNKFINEEIIKEKIEEEKIVPVEPDEIFPLVSLRTRRNMKSLKEILDCSDHSDISEHENLELDKAVNHESDSSELSIKSAKKTDSKSSIDHNSFFPSNLPQNVQEIFMVEKILKMKIINGVRKFFLKWEGFPDSENTWEPEENLECPELIKEFLKEQKKIKSAKKRKRLLSADSLNLEELPEEVIIKEPAVKPRGFPRSREPESILAAGMMNDQMMFLIKWKNVDMANLVSARRANIECPQVVIRFYENHLNWESTSHLNLASVPKENLANPIEDEFTKINKTISKKLSSDPASTMNTLISLLDNDYENIPVRKPTNFPKIKPKPVNRKTIIPHRVRPLSKLFERKTNTETLPKTAVIGSSSNSMMDLINNFKGPRALLPHKLPVTNTVSRPLPPPTPLENLSRVYESRDIPKEQTPPPKFELPKPNQTQVLRPINSYRPDFNPRRFGISSRPLLNASQHPQINSSQKIQMPSLTPNMTMPTLKAAPTLALIHQPNSLINFQSPSSNYDASSSINTYIDNSSIDQKNISLPNSNNNNNNFNRYLQVVDSITNNTPIPQTTLHQLLQHDQKPSFNQIIEPQINNYLQTTDQSIHNKNNVNNNVNNVNNNNNPNNFINTPINHMRSMTASINQQMIPQNRSIQSDFHQNYNNNNNNNNNNRNSTRMQLVSALQTRYQNTNPQIITMHPNIIPTTNLPYLSNNQLNSMSATPQYQYVINTNNNINQQQQQQQQQNNYNQNNIIQQQQQQQQQTYYTQQPSMSPSPIINANTRFILPKMDTFSMQATTDMNQHLILQSSHNNQYQQRINNPQNNPEILQNSYLLEHFCN